MSDVASTVKEIIVEKLGVKESEDSRSKLYE